MPHVTHKIADKIYTILVETIKAPNEEHWRWSFCYNMTFPFPHPEGGYIIQSELVAPWIRNNSSHGDDRKRDNIIRIFDGNPLVLKVTEPDIFQIEPIKKANALIAKMMKRRKKVLENV